ncbi:MAG: peptidylprolyl isomerase [Euryarchaeota archaeon]|nr:peptidylprolyl isomerase [Euryarchaeota archaeon]
MSASEKRKRAGNPPSTQPKKSSRKWIISLFVIFILCIAAVAFVLLQKPSSNNGNTPVPEGNPIAVFNTSKGTFKVKLYKDKMPITTDNFVKLINDKFYDGLIFHRISDNFMIQAGRYFPDGSQKTNPYANIAFETSDVTHVDGAISMASTGTKVGGGAEFFICDGARHGLDGSYAAFGVVTEGMTVVQTIAATEHDRSLEPTPENPTLPGGGKPLQDITIHSIRIE